MTNRVIVHASEILTGVGVRKKDGRHIQEQDLGRIQDGAIVYSVRKIGKNEIPSKILWVGPTSDLPKKWKKTKKTNLAHRAAIVPGFVDCHNHLIFAGDRSDEFAQRCAGVSYQEIAAKGGGIRATVSATRNANPAELEALASQRLEELYAYGVRTVEVKSGYGLSFEAEKKILEIIPRLQKKYPKMTLTATFLGAHAFPPDETRENYIHQILHTMLPEIARKKLADSCDVFVDEGYYTLAEGRRILTAARDLGLNIKIHADELANTESSALAAELGALSADHLLKISKEGIQKLAQSNTVAVLLPGTAFYLKAPYAPARELIDSGACVALATDFNPGTCMTLSLPVIMTLSALYLGMSRAEIFAAVTFNPAKALGLHKTKGTLEAGMDADFTKLPFARFEEIYYRFASLQFR